MVFAVLLAAGCGRASVPSPVPVDPPETEEPPAGVVDPRRGDRRRGSLCLGDGAQVRSVYRFPPPSHGHHAGQRGAVGRRRRQRAPRHRHAQRQRLRQRRNLAAGETAPFWWTAPAGWAGRVVHRRRARPQPARTFAGRVGDGGQAVLAVGGQRLFVAPDGGARCWWASATSPSGPVFPSWPTRRSRPVQLRLVAPGEGTGLIGYRMAALLDASPTEARFVFRWRTQRAASGGRRPAVVLGDAPLARRARRHHHPLRRRHLAGG